MDDFVVNVRQIGQYPNVGDFVGPTDLVLVQQNGLGGPYATAYCNTLVSTALRTAGNLELATGFGLFWNGQTLTWNGSAFQFSGQVKMPSLVADAAIVGNSAVATQTWVGEQLDSVAIQINNTVHSFNGRNGDVFLAWQDVYVALNLSPNDIIATQAFVGAEVCAQIQNFYNLSPFVFTWNGRVGDVFLQLEDIERAFFAPGALPSAPTPPLGNASHRIATTAFVDNSLLDLHATINQEWNAADFALLDLLQTSYAPLNSPSFVGTPNAPTPPPNANDGRLATTAFVMSAITASVTGVISFNGRTGAITLTNTDVYNAGAAPRNSPVFTGIPTVPMPAASDDSNQIASTAWVLSEISGISAGVTSFNGRSGLVTLQLGDITAAGGAPLTSPALQGTPTAPTPTAGSNNTQIATTAFVMANAGVTSFNGRQGAVSFQANDISAVGGALLSSPAFTAVPTAPTAPPGTNTQQLATTAFVAAALGGGGIVNSFNGRSGSVTLQTADLPAASGALLTVAASPPTGAAATANSALWWDSNSGQLLINFNDGNSTQWVSTNNIPPASLVTYASWVINSTQTWTTPANSTVATVYRVRMVGGGGGGAAGSTTFDGGGGGGAQGKEFIITGLAAGTAATCTIGTGGAGSAVQGTAGANGIASQFVVPATGTTVVCNAGQGGGTGTGATYNWPGPGGNGGVTTPGSATVTLLSDRLGQDGDWGTTITAAGSSGGNSLLGWGGRQNFSSGFTGSVKGNGAGGGGGALNATTPFVGIAGSGGVIIIERIQG